MHIRKHIPNTLTCCNLLCGCLAVGCALGGILTPEGSSCSPWLGYGGALAFIIAGAVFDFFDGFAARALGVSSPIGKELDSLADCITFGFAPAAIVVSLLTGLSPFQSTTHPLPHLLPGIGLLIAAFSALRLAKFNLDERQTTSFIGLPTPANALFWAALAYGQHERLAAMPGAFWAIAAGALLSCWLLVSEIPMFALKFKAYGWAGNRLRYSFVIFSAILLVALGWSGIPVVIVAYILLSLLANRRAS